MIADRILGRADGGTVTLTKADLIEAVAAKAGITKRDAEGMINAALASMIESLRAGESIEVRGFGSFGTRCCGLLVALCIPETQIAGYGVGALPMPRRWRKPGRGASGGSFRWSRERPTHESRNRRSGSKRGI